MDPPDTCWTRVGNWIARHPFIALAIVGVVAAVMIHAETLIAALFFGNMRLDF